MTIDLVRNALLWCTVINFGLLLFGALLFILAHDWLYRIYSRWFRLSVEQFDCIVYASLVLYKAGIILFNLVPYIALRIVA